MSSGSDPPENSPSSQSHSLTPSERGGVILPVTIEQACIEELNRQLKGLQFSASIDKFPEKRSEGVVTYEFIEILKEGGEQAKRFLIDVINFNLAGIDEKLDVDFEGKINVLKITCDKFISKFRDSTKSEDGIFYIYIYLIYLKRPNLAYEITIRDYVKNVRIRGIKFIARGDICGFQSIVSLDLHVTYRKEIQDHLKELLDLDEKQLDLSLVSPSLKKETKPKPASEPLRIPNPYRLRLINIIKGMPDFTQKERKAFIEDYLGIKLDGSFPQDESGQSVASRLVACTLNDTGKFKYLLEGLLAHDDITDSEKGDNKSFLKKLLEDCCPGEQ